MDFVYFSRQFNRSGYYVLSRLLKHSRYAPQAVILPHMEPSSPLDDPESQEREVKRYEQECAFYGCRPLRFLKSIRLLAMERSIPVMSLRTMKDDFAHNRIRALEPDLIVLGGGWPELLPERIVDIPRLGVINTHPSMLPAFRGADVHRWQVYHGVRESGVTIHYVDEMFDTGNTLGQIPVPVGPDDTPQELAEKTAVAAGPLMIDVLGRIAAAAPERVEAERQTHRNEVSRYFSRWPWENPDFLAIDWNRSAEDICRLVLACTQESYRYNGPFFFAGGRRNILRACEVKPARSDCKAGRVTEIGRTGIEVSCGSPGSVLLMTQVQPGTPRGWPEQPHDEPALDAYAFAERAALAIGDVLTSGRGGDR